MDEAKVKEEKAKIEKLKETLEPKNLAQDTFELFKERIALIKEMDIILAGIIGSAYILKLSCVLGMYIGIIDIGLSILYLRWLIDLTEQQYRALTSRGHNMLCKAEDTIMKPQEFCESSEARAWEQYRKEQKKWAIDDYCLHFFTALFIAAIFLIIYPYVNNNHQCSISTFNEQLFIASTIILSFTVSSDVVVRRFVQLISWSAKKFKISEKYFS